MSTVAEHVPFLDLCRMCEQVCKRKGKDKHKYIADFLNHWRDFHLKLHKDNPETTDSFFPALRLLLPQCEKERAAYGIKEHTMAELIISIFCLDKNSADAQKLLKYRSPRSAKADAGDFGSVAYFVLKNRCPDKGSLKIHDINTNLDAISMGHATGNKGAIKASLLHLFRNTSALETKWLIRMILKDMKMGVSEYSVLNTFHVDAKDLYNVTNSLKKVCIKLRDPNVRLHEIEVSIFSPFRPMLSDLAQPTEVEKLMGNQSFFIETKFDGERLQLHKEGNMYKYFSRNGHDVTHVYGSSPLEGKLTPFIHECFKSSVSQCILDGELVIYSNKSGCIVSKGENADVQALDPDGDYKPCYCAFDILLLNSKVLSNVPLQERAQILKDIISPIEGKLHLSQQKKADTNEEVIMALNEAIDRRDEGIVIKNPMSIYRPNMRKNGGWLKVKPEYIDNLCDELDLLIIGGYFGDGRRANKISHFLLGVAEPSNIQGEKPQNFLSVCKVGSGYSDSELENLLSNLTSHWEVYNAKNPPHQIIIGSGKKERPEVWVEPSKSFIVQVKAAEIVRSEKFATNCTLRFPRVQKIRYDKSWHECMTTQELEDMRTKSKGMLANRLEFPSEEDQEPSPKKVKKSRQVIISVAPQFRPSDVSGIEQMSSLLNDKEFCVICSSIENKKLCEKLITEHGGNFVQNPRQETYCVLADKITLKVNNIIHTDMYDVVKSSWLINCIEKQCLLPWVPDDMFHSKPSTLVAISKNFDEYGDNYTEEVTKDSLQKVFSGIKKEKWESRCISHREIADLEFKYFSQCSEYGLFRICRVYIDDKLSVNDPSSEIPSSYLKLTMLKLKLYGADITSVIDDCTTHVVVFSKDIVRLHVIEDIALSRKSRFHIVTEKWVNRSIQHKNLLQEKEFYPVGMQN